MNLTDWLNRNRVGQSQVAAGPIVVGADTASTRKILDFSEKIHSEVVKRLNRVDDLNEEEVTQLASSVADEIATSERQPINRSEHSQAITNTVYEVTGLGPITPYLHDDSVSEIMVNGPDMVYVERGGKLEKTNCLFRDNNHVTQIIEKIVSAIGRRIDEAQPMVDARLLDGSRVNAVIPPLSLNGPCLTIRKFAANPYTIQDLIRFGTLTTSMARFLELCVWGRLNIVVSGSTSSGKTSTLGVLSAFIPENERIITVEDAAELQLRQPHVVRLETRPPNIEGKGMVTIRDLVRNCLRMRPDRIIVGEVRSGEALDMLQAMNTGHDGSMTTGHSNGPRDMISRLETMILMAGVDLPLRAIREQIASGIDLIVHQARFRDGSRRITHISEVLGMEGDVIQIQDIFRFHETGVDLHGNTLGELRATGIRPLFLEQIEAKGFLVPDSIFAN